MPKTAKQTLAPGKLDGKIAIVTGSDSGIGQAIAIEFANAGAHVVITYLHDKKGAMQTQRQVEAANRHAIVLNIDVREPEDVERLFKVTRDKLGVPFILVNNAGVPGPGDDIADISLKDWDEVLKTNLYGPFLCCQQFVRARRADGGRGKLINITSVHEDLPTAGFGAYDAAKGGLRMLTRTLCLEVARDRINVNNIAPGYVLTPMTEKDLDTGEKHRKETRDIPFKRVARPEEIAKLALYLASDDSDYATGQSFVIDGGLTLNMQAG
jgi:glucose 1-dehydrogenase